MAPIHTIQPGDLVWQFASLFDSCGGEATAFSAGRVGKIARRLNSEGTICRVSMAII
jgi:hypothetical protein